MINKEEAVLQVRDVLLRMATAASAAAAGSRWKRTAVPAAVLSGLYAMYPLTFIPEKY